jgi:adenosylcobinamide-phosphate synthase
VRAAEIALGWLLDALFGDPEPHPVRGIGRVISRLEPVLHPLGRKGGVLLVLLVAGGTWLASWGMVAFAVRLHPWLGVLASSVLVFYAMSLRTLDREVRAVARALAGGDLPEARRRVGRIVGRDTGALDPAAVARAAVEAAAESSVDGVTAPLLFAAVGGGPLAMAYRAVNTLDSMVGHKDARYREFGWASARLDDLLNFLPARVTGCLLVLSASLAGEDAAGAWRIFRRDRLRHASPNAGHPEAAMAGALGLRLGGPSAYAGETVDKPWMGDGSEAVEAGHILRGMRLVHVASVLALGTCVALTVC